MRLKVLSLSTSKKEKKKEKRKHNKDKISEQGINWFSQPTVHMQCKNSLVCNIILSSSIENKNNVE